MASGLKQSITRWAAKWISENRRDGRSEHLLCKACTVGLFRTRADARAFIRAEYGYIATRADLRQEPHGWKMPQAIRVMVTYEELKGRR